MLFDFHTHKKGAGIYNYRLGFDKDPPPQIGEFSMGIHPWDVESIVWEQTFCEFEKYLKLANCVAIGEIGLDKICGTNLDLQKEVFLKQICVAEESQKKVLIIHCVKAYQELIALRKGSKNTMIWVLHGFNGGKGLIDQLVQHGFYFSIGHLVLNPKTKIAQNISTIPLDQLFLETDESEIEIEEIYKEVSRKYGMEEKDLIHQIEKNKKHIFSE